MRDLPRDEVGGMRDEELRFKVQGFRFSLYLATCTFLDPGDEVTGGRYGPDTGGCTPSLRACLTSASSKVANHSALPLSTR
jgi:hypothetical protein